ncbi:hypothetical protein ACNKU7_08440 [Microbulbifer sp. SA54]|uniref:hypothetical protein n=1 Tax=Microbulbifer sp. SA54 TaxID=3401577 RepID=UPI003AAF2AE6
MKLILHIGSDKTGTTAIQSILSNNRQILSDLGVCYPNLTKATHHEELAHEIIRGQQGLAWKALREILKQDHKYVILSSEMLCTLNNKHIRVLKEWLGNIDTTIIAYIRRSDEYLESGIKQRLKGLQSKEDFSRFYLKYKWIPAIFCPQVYASAFKSRFIFNWLKVFRKDQIRVRPYNNTQWKENNIFQDFLHTAGLENYSEHLKGISQKKNVTPDIYTIYGVALFNNSSRPTVKTKFSETIINKYPSENHLISSYAKRYLALKISQLYAKRLFKDFNVKLPVNEIAKESHRPSMSSIINIGQSRLIEFAITQQKQINQLKKRKT